MLKTNKPRHLLSLATLAWGAVQTTMACAVPAAVPASNSVPLAAPAAGEGAAKLPQENQAVARDTVVVGAPAATGGQGIPQPPAEPNPIAVRATDPSWGSATAPVTIVIFSDFQCPFCSRGAATVEQLKQAYGQARLRVVWKNLPLPFHDRARPAAEAAMAVFDALGPQGFWAFHDKVFANQRALSDDNLVQYARDAGVVDEALFRRELAAKRHAARVEADLQMAGGLGVSGTPAFFVNGVLVSGAQPFAVFDAIVRREFSKADERKTAGILPENLYAAMVRVNYTPPSPRAPAADDEDAVDTTVHALPLGLSPQRGSSDALVTVVVFSDFECPFCKRAAFTLEAIAKRYGSALRVVWKHEPLPFHPNAEPAAEFAEEARAQKGDAGFWLAHDALFGLAKIDRASILSLEGKLALKAGSVAASLDKHLHAKAIEADEDVAEAFEAKGTPHFFVNGRRLVGAQPEGVFVKVIDEEVAKAKALVAGGMAARDVYAHIISTGKKPAEFERKPVPAPTGKEPFRGGATAKIVITQFSDFQCPFCSRAEPVVDEVMKAYGLRVKLVWRNLPLPMHPDAPVAAEAALEAQRQKGNDGFWRMQKKLFGAPDLGVETLHRLAQEEGLDVNAFDAALRDHRHKAAVDLDRSVAEAAGIHGTPAFVVNGRFISGAQPFKKFRRAIEDALTEAK